jgi:hypothetical protein
MGGRGSGRIAAENEWVDKPWWYLIAFDYQIFSIRQSRIPWVPKRGQKYEGHDVGAGPNWVSI